MGNSTSIPVHELTETDFSRQPVWRFDLDAEDRKDIDESHAAPDSVGLGLGTYGSFMVRAKYMLANGQEFPGAVQVDVLDPRAHFTPAFLFAGNKPIDPLAPDAEARIARITKQSSTRPVKWTLEVMFAGEVKARSGRIAKLRMVRGLGLLARLILLRFSRRSA